MDDNHSVGGQGNLGGHDAAASAQSTVDCSIGGHEVAPLRLNDEDWLVQRSQYAPKEDRTAGPHPPNEAHSGLAEAMQTGTGVAGFCSSALEPTPLRETPVRLHTSNQIGQELESSIKTNNRGVFTDSSEILCHMAAQNTAAPAQPQGSQALGWTEREAPVVNYASNAPSQPQPSQWPLASAGGIQNQTLALQQQNIALLQLLLHNRVFIPPQVASLGTAMLFPSAPLASGAANSNPQAGMTLPSSVSGHSAPSMPDGGTLPVRIDGAGNSDGQVIDMGTSTAVGRGSGVERTDNLQGGYRGNRKPKRALTAYNIFFRDERARLLEDSEVDNSQAGKDDNDGAYKTVNISGKKRRRRRKVPERKKIGFEEMGKIIGKNWKQIDPERHTYYVKQAAEEKKRYKSELAIYNQRQVGLIEAERLRQEATVSEETRKRYLENGEKNGLRKVNITRSSGGGKGDKDGSAIA